MSLRIKKINELIRKHISEILQKEVSLKSGVFVTIMKVDTSRDLRYARLFISVFPEKEKEYAVKTLQNERVNIQKVLHKKLATQPLPKIEFIADDTESKADEVERILQSLKS